MRHGVRRKKTTPPPPGLDLRPFIGRGELSLDGEAGNVVSDFYAMAEAIAAGTFVMGSDRYSANAPGRLTPTPFV